jgi:catalase
MRSLEHRAVHAEREIRGFSLRLVEEGNWTSPANKPHDRPPVFITG